MVRIFNFEVRLRHAKMLQNITRILNSLIDSKVDGHPINGFQELVNKLHATKGTYLTLETERGSRLIIDVKAAKSANPDILKRNQIPQQFSADVARWLLGEKK